MEHSLPLAILWDLQAEFPRLTHELIDDAVRMANIPLTIREMVHILHIATDMFVELGGEEQCCSRV